MSNIRDSIGTADEVGITIIRGKKEEKKPDYTQKNTVEVNRVYYGDNTPSSTKEIND